MYLYLDVIGTLCSDPEKYPLGGLSVEENTNWGDTTIGLTLVK